MIIADLTLLLLVLWYPDWGQYVIPIPTQAQLSWQDAELAALVCLDLHSFDNKFYVQKDVHVPPIKDYNFRGELDLSVITTPDSRLNNFYIGGLDWMLRNYEIGGVYIDDSALDRITLLRARKIIDKYRSEGRMEQHSWNHFNQWAGNANCLNLYMDMLPYFDLVNATLYKGLDEQIVAVAKWSKKDQPCSLDIDWNKMGYEKQGWDYMIPAIPGYHKKQSPTSLNELIVPGSKGFLIILRKTDG